MSPELVLPADYDVQNLGVDDYDVWNLAIPLIGPSATEVNGIVAIVI